MDNSEFEPSQHFIAYIDMLGYRAKIKEHGAAELARSISKKFEESEQIIKENGDERKQIKWKAFSDNVLFCTEESCMPLIGLMAFFQIKMIQENLFVRGALCHSQLYFDEKFICGDGIILAHEIESEIAIFPRIILHQSYIRAIDNFYEHKPTSYPQFKAGIYQEDVDGQKFLDYLELVFDFFLNENINEMKIILSNHAEQIKNNLSRNTNERTLQKYHWAKNYHNQFCKDHGFESFIIP